MCSEKDKEMKKKYAREIILNKGDSYRAALKILGTEYPGPALQMTAAWHDDPEVVAEMERIKATEPDLGMPSKEEVLDQLWKIGTSEYTGHKERIEALKQYATIRGYMKSEEKSTVTVPSVMVVPGFGNNDDWETIALKQQRSSRGIAEYRPTAGRGN